MGKGLGVDVDQVRVIFEVLKSLQFVQNVQNIKNLSFTFLEISISTTKITLRIHPAMKSPQPRHTQTMRSNHNKRRFQMVFLQTQSNQNYYQENIPRVYSLYQQENKGG